MGGLACQRWDLQSPHQHSFSTSQNSELVGNLCRNPGEEDHADHVWCFTTDPNVRWDFCDVQCTCNEYCISPVHDDYKGCVSTTVSGRTCQRWDSLFPHSHSYRNSNLDGNFCRSTGDGYPAWCYTTDPDKRWEYCDITCDGSGTPPPQRNAVISSGGGAIHAEGGSRVTLSAVVVEDCEAILSGGGISLHASSLWVEGKVHLRNCAARRGGCISAVDGSTVDLHDQVWIQGGAALEVGGAVHLSASGLTASLDVAFRASSAPDGGCINAAEASTVVLTDGVEMERCHAGSTGGAVHLSEESRLEAYRNVSFRDNIAQSYGGAVFVGAVSSATLADGVQVLRCVSLHGAGVSLESPLSTLEASRGVEFRGNWATGNGGAIDIGQGCTAELRDGVDLIANSAGEMSVRVELLLHII